MNPGPVKIKVCGLTQAANAVACVEAGADWIGLNFHPSSPRSINADRGLEIVAALHALGKGHPVGLFVDRPFPELAETILEAGGIDMIQLHGNEPPEYLLECRRYKPPLRLIKAFRLADATSVDRMVAYLERTESLGCSPYAILVDAYVPDQLGGTGHSIPFDVLDHLPGHPRLILAGGLTPSNVADRVARVRPWMVDVASGVESSPGVKDLAKVAEFAAAARRMAPSNPEGNRR